MKFKYLTIFDKNNNNSFYEDTQDIKIEGFIDSGTTLSYFPKNVYTTFLENFKKFCRLEGKCLSLSQFTNLDNSWCFEKDKETDISDFWSSFPTIVFTFSNDQTYIWFPRNYFYEVTEKSNISFCKAAAVAASGFSLASSLANSSRF